MRISCRRVLGTALAVAFGAAPWAATADYPERAVQFIVPFNAGGGTDVSQRTFNKYAEPLVGQSIVVVNKPGAGGTTGWAELVRARPDGYTLATVTVPQQIVPALAKPRQTGYKLDQLTNICVYAIVPDVLLVREESDWKTMADLVAHAKANPKKLKASNTGTLGADFMTTLYIEHAAGVEFTQVPFTGGSKALQAILAGNTDVMVASARYAVSQKGKLRTLGIATRQRFPLVEDIPTFVEQGYDVVSQRYRAIAGPPGLPQSVVEYWEGICKKVSDDPAFVAEMDKVGQPAGYLGTAETNEDVERITGVMQRLIDHYKLAE
ncbi:MAG: tripartite tricarboxylate transporter substrate binding protein [Ectothiorhodospiraceae bacterium]|nr:tripartite tricarboxylate transporter substrate binding protein [Ectothiorhodospiraceae bacterium]